MRYLLAVLCLASSAWAVPLRYTFDQTAGCEVIDLWNVQIDGAWKASLPQGADCGLGVVRTVTVDLPVGEHTTAIAAVFGAEQTGWSNVVRFTVGESTTTTVTTETSTTTTVTTTSSTTSTTLVLIIPAPSKLTVEPL